MSNNVYSAIENALRTTLNLSPATPVAAETKLKEDLGLDSMSTLTFLIALEESVDGFIVDPDSLDVEHLESVGSVHAYVSSAMSA